MNVINKLIPADQLHWCEEDGRYTAISREELDQILQKCDHLNHDQTLAVVNWYQIQKTGTLLCENFIKGRISVEGVNEDGEPFFAPVEL